MSNLISCSLAMTSSCFYIHENKKHGGTATKTNGTDAELLLNVDEDNMAWDMQVEDTDGNPLEWYDIDIGDMPSDGFVIELLWDGSEGTANLLEDMTQLEGDYSAV